jgi:citrate lyase subunit beta/citryl-CoA lyase
MTATVRPRRSVLYMPGANTRALEKARSLPADALIFDLEDAVAPDAKAAARANVVAAAQSKAYGKREIVIRCNGLNTEWGRADIAAIATSGADAILVPKLEGAADVTNVVALLDAAGAPASMAVWGMMETPRGILRAEEIAGASSGLPDHGHQRPGEGSARAAHAGPAADGRAAGLHLAGGARPWARDPRRRLQ